jgi:hypothetical protein
MTLLSNPDWLALRVAEIICGAGDRELPLACLSTQVEGEDFP